MCGICGVFDYVHRKPVAPRLIEDMCAAMRHRGPDDTGTFEREGLCLGHVRLSIIDLTHGAQPMSNEDGAITVVFNGEIYNHLELRDELAANGHVLKTRSDTEVLVHLYEDHGFEMCHKLIGEFAFAIWDDREQLLFAARDRLGVKPLIYAVSDGRFAFASDFNALMTDRRISRELDDDGLASYLTFQTILAPRTIYRAVHKLPPGHYAVVRKGDVRVVRYWDVEFAPDESRSVESFAEEIDDLVTDSVRRQMIADVDLGAFLSGGLDSSTIVTKMTRLAGRGVKTFSIGFKDQRYDESKFYKMLAAQLGVEHHEFVFEPHLLEDVADIVRHFGEPCSIASAFPIYYLSKLASEHVKVVLTGDGVDEIFAGYHLYYHYVRRVRQFQRCGGTPLAKPMLAALGWTKSLRTTSRIGNTARRARRFLELAALPEERWLPYMRVNRSPKTTPAALLGRDADSVLHAAEAPYVDAFRRANGTGDWVWPRSYGEMMTTLPDEMFQKLDRMTMAHSIEGRVPWCDYRLVELAGKIPADLKMHGRIGKYVVRRAVADQLPPAIMKRPKVGFIVPLDDWFRGELRTMTYDLLTDASFKQSGIFAQEVVEHIITEHMAERQRFGSAIWNLVAFELWRRAQA